MSSWNEMKLDDAVIINPKITLQKGCLYKYVSMSNLLPFTKKINNYILKEYTGGGAKFTNGDTLFARITPCLENGKTAFVDILEEKEYGFGSTEFIVIRGRKGITENHFVYYLFLSPKIRTKAIQLMSGSSGRQRVQVDALKLIKIKIPPLDEQKKISTILSIIDQKIELNQKMNKVLEEMAQAIFKSWFIDFEPFKDGEFEYNEELDKEIPKGWAVGKLKEVINLHDSKRIPLSKIERKKRKGIYPYYGAASILDYIDNYIFDGIFLLMAEDGSVIDNNEKPILQYVHGKFWANNHVHVIQGKNEFCTEFVMLHLMNINIRPYITGAVQLKINQGNLFRIPIIKPDKTTLLKFREIIEPIYEKIRKNKDEINILIKLRDILLPQLISGRLRITNSEKFLEEIDNENN